MIRALGLAVLHGACCVAKGKSVLALPLIIITSLLAGLSAAAMLWFGADFAYKLKHVIAQRRRAQKAAEAEAGAMEKGKGEGKRPAK